MSPPFLLSHPTRVGKGEARRGDPALLPCSSFGCRSPAFQSRRTLRLTGQGQKRPSATCGDASPPSPVCRARAFCTGGAKFGLNLPLFLRYLSRPPLRTRLLRTCSSQAGDGCPQHASSLINSLHKSSPSPVSLDFKARAPLLCAW